MCREPARRAGTRRQDAAEWKPSPNGPIKKRSARSVGLFFCGWIRSDLKRRHGANTWSARRQDVVVVPQAGRSEPAGRGRAQTKSEWAQQTDGNAVPDKRIQAQSDLKRAGGANTWSAEAQDVPRTSTDYLLEPCTAVAIAYRAIETICSGSGIGSNARTTR